MTIYVHEWKQNQKSLWIWTIAVAAMILICMMLYPQMKEQADSVSEMFSQMGGFSSAFGMDQVNFGDALGFFAIECGNVLALGGVMFSALLGIGMLGKEENLHTAEFLLTHPISRRRVLAQKLAAMYTLLVVFYAINFVVITASFLGVGEEIPWKELEMVYAANLLLAFEVSSICYAVSAFLRTASAGMGIGIGILLYFFNLYGNIAKDAEWVKYVTPFSYADASKIIADGALDTKLLWLGLVYLVVGIAIAFFRYIRKDIA